MFSYERILIDASFSNAVVKNLQLYDRLAHCESCVQDIPDFADKIDFLTLKKTLFFRELRNQ